MKRWMTVALVVTSVQVAGYERVRLDAAQQARAGIVVRPVLERSFGDQQRVVGQVVRTPGSTAVLKSIVAGRVENIRVAPGDTVRAGQVVAELHSHDILATQGELLRAAGRSALADKRLEAGQELYAVDGISRLDLEVREQDVFAARLEFDTRYQELIDHGVPPAVLDEILESKVPDPHLPITAPVGGVVLDLEIQLHEWVQEYAPLVVIGDPKQVELELQIAPDRAMSVAAGDVVDFAPVGRPAEAGRASVVTRVPQVDPATRTIRIRADIVEGGETLFPGAFVEGTLIHGSARTAPSVPLSSVISVGGEDVVFVQHEPGVFEMRPVQLGLSNEARYEVVSGVAVGEDVAVQGVFFLKSALVKGDGGEE